MPQIYEYVGSVVNRKLREPRRHSRQQVIRWLFQRVTRRSYWVEVATTR